ncbi:hypothetical protein AB2B38_002910 [Balneola sp. MJW-20]|uniref:hypothetical protein n=1 Tax=Gracilimonas aurantiaca TaxID=3234185 RepID=UPI0034677A95
MEDYILRYIHGSLPEDDCKKLWEALRNNTELIERFNILEGLYFIRNQGTEHSDC